MHPNIHLRPESAAKSLRALWLPRKPSLALGALVIVAALLSGCVRPGAENPRRGDEIMVCGRLFHTGAPVVLWTDPGGYDAYRTERRFVPWKDAAWSPPGEQGAGRSPETPNRYGTRFAKELNDHSAGPLSLDEFERIRGGGWDLPTLQRTVDQFVIHYDVCGTSRQCFRVLHDVRGLSIHFMLDIDGTIYQTLDLKERAWHATTSNDRAIGIEIANIGAYPVPRESRLAARDSDGDSTNLPQGGSGREAAGGGSGSAPSSSASSSFPLPPILQRWYTLDHCGARITLPDTMGDGGVRTPDFVGYSARPDPVIGTIQGTELVQFDLTPEQYDSLTKLTAALCAIFPNMPCDYPRNAEGKLLTDVLPPDQLASYRGLIGHYHIQKNKIDPGPAFDWDRVVNGARKRLGQRGI